MRADHTGLQLLIEPYIDILPRDVSCGVFRFYSLMPVAIAAMCGSRAAAL